MPCSWPLTSNPLELFPALDHVKRVALRTCIRWKLFTSWLLYLKTVVENVVLVIITGVFLYWNRLFLRFLHIKSFFLLKSCKDKHRKVNASFDKKSCANVYIKHICLSAHFFFECANWWSFSLSYLLSIFILLSEFLFLCFPYSHYYLFFFTF